MISMMILADKNPGCHGHWSEESEELALEKCLSLAMYEH